MKRIALLTILLVSFVFCVPTYAGKPTKAPPGIRAYDATGILLGTLVGMEHLLKGTHSDFVYIPSLGKFFRFTDNGTNFYVLQQIWVYTPGDFTEYDPAQYPYPPETQWTLCCGHIWGVQHFIVTFAFTASDSRHFSVDYDPDIAAFRLTEVQFPFNYPVVRPITFK
jgi:hypothetical protein